MTGRVLALAGMMAAFGALAACQPSHPGGGGSGPLALPAIEVTALDAAPAGEAGGARARGGPASGVSADAPADAAPGMRAGDPAAGETRAAATPAGEALAGEASASGTSTPAASTPAASRSPAQLACERRKGVWTRTESGSRACVHYTRDGGKECRRAGDCEGECLARSGSCAPIRPLFGCNDILDDTGRRMTSCLD